MRTKRKKMPRGDSIGASLRKFIDEYKRETNCHTINLDRVAAWAISSGRYVPPPADARKTLAKAMQRASREDYIEDDNGDPVRRRHSYGVKRGEEQLTLWVNMEDATDKQMQLCFSQRRRAILKDNEQLDRDCRYFNAKYNKGKQLVIDFDYTLDMHDNTQSTEYDDTPPEDFGDYDDQPQSGDPKKSR